MWKMWITDNLLNIINYFLFLSEVPRTLSLLQGFRFKPATGPAWKAAFEGQISEQFIFDNIVGNLVSIVRSIFAWLAIELIVHRGQNFFQKFQNENQK